MKLFKVTDQHYVNLEHVALVLVDPSRPSGYTPSEGMHQIFFKYRDGNTSWSDLSLMNLEAVLKRLDEETI